MAVPAYIPPADSASWDQLTGAGEGLGVVVANPNSGPGTSVDPAWQGVIDATHGNGTRVIGYVDTGYFGFTGRQTEGGSTDAAAWTAQAKRHIDTWYSLYGDSVDGIFFDDGLGDCGPESGSEEYVTLYRELNDYVHSTHPGSLTVDNPAPPRSSATRTRPTSWSPTRARPRTTSPRPRVRPPVPGSGTPTPTSSGTSSTTSPRRPGRRDRQVQGEQRRLRLRHRPDPGLEPVSRPARRRVLLRRTRRGAGHRE
ncbi:spherulation-specific family 4 protein [Streptomyces sp. M19]